MKHVASILIAVLLAGCAGIPFITGHDPVDKLGNDIDAVLADSIFIPARASIKVVSLDRNEVLYEHDSKMLIRPASNMKLLTTATVLADLGTEYRFKTAVLVDSVDTTGTVRGNVYLKGYGDPDLKSTDLDSLAMKLAQSGIKSIQGKVIADVSFFDDEFWGNGWMWDDEPDPDAAFLSALAVNDNCIKVIVRPGVKAGDTLIVTTEPQTSYVTVRNSGVTVADSVRAPLNVTRLFKQRLNTITVSGEMLADTSSRREIRLTVWRPEMYAARLFVESLRHAGIQFSGTDTIGIVPSTAHEVADHDQRMDSMVVNLNKISDNLSADMTLKTIGALRYGTPGSARSGISAVHQFVSGFGIDTTKFLMVDGSGLSHYNLLTAEMITQLLVGMSHRKDLFPLYYASLPVAGVDGTLRNRMRATVAEGNIHAKTGSISGVSSLSGFVTTRDGEMLAFSMAMQNFILPSSYYRLAQDRICELLARFSRNKSVAGRN